MFLARCCPWYSFYSMFVRKYKLFVIISAVLLLGLCYHFTGRLNHVNERYVHPRLAMWTTHYHNCNSVHITSCFRRRRPIFRSYLCRGVCAPKARVRGIECSVIIDARGASITYGDLGGVVCSLSVSFFLPSFGLRWCGGMFSRALISKKVVPKRSENCLTLNQGHESYSVPEL